MLISLIFHTKQNNFELKGDMVECQNIEWKESWNDDLLKWICGFANAQGGKLYIGISDDGSVCGVPKIKKVLEDIPNKVRDVLGIKEIFSCILANQKVSRKSIAKQLGVSTKTIYRHLSEMREYVVCEGKGKGTSWRIVSANVPHSVHKNVPHSAAIKLDGVKGKIYNYILANPNVSINSISKHLGLSIDMISGCLSEMREYVVCEGQGKMLFLELSLQMSLQMSLILSSKMSLQIFLIQLL